MLKGLLSRWSLLLILRQKGRDEILCLIGDLAPDCILEGKFTKFNLLHDLLVRSAVEWRYAREHDVGDDTAGPDIALWTVVLREDLWSNVVGRAQLLVQLLRLVEDQRRAEINDLYLVEFLVLLEEDIFWLQVPVDYVINVAVIDAGEDLFHQD